METNNVKNTAEVNYIQINRDLWNCRTAVHLDSDFYDLGNFIKGKTSLNEIELSLLGNISGETVLHLQCHFGQDSISLVRMGANVTGVDLSDKAIEAANQLANKLQENPNFICCDLYDLPTHLNDKFDIIFASYGTICWLPDTEKWAGVITHFLKPGGKLIFVEFHPVMWMFDNDFKEVTYRYFNTEAIVETEEGTYADKLANINLKSVSWNHGIAEVLTSLVNVGLKIDAVREYDYSPYNCVRHMIEVEPGKFRIKHLGNKIPMVYSVVATKPIANT